MLKKQAVWETKHYYAEARKASLDLSHPGLQIIKAEARRSRKILEVGCGEGSKLAHLTAKAQEIYGVDISKTAISLAKKQYPWIHFQVVDAQQLPFPSHSFDLVFTAFVMEHTANPEKIISEMIRVLQVKGKLIILAPNYGAPNRTSPCFKGSRLKKLFWGLLKDFYWCFFPIQDLSWEKVKPITTKDIYQIDWDTTVEPYLASLVKYLKKKGPKIEVATSFWGEIKEKETPWQAIFKFFGKARIYPFIYWGPHLLIVAQKK